MYNVLPWTSLTGRLLPELITISVQAPPVAIDSGYRMEKDPQLVLHREEGRQSIFNNISVRYLDSFEILASRRDVSFWKRNNLLKINKDTSCSCDIILVEETRPSFPEVDEESQLGIVLSQLLLIPGLPSIHEFASSFCAKVYPTATSFLSPKFSIPVIYYNQIGNSRSTQLPSKPPSFWTIDLFIDELVNLLEHFHFQEGLSLVLTNSSADIGMWNASTGELSKAFPDDVQKGLAVGVADMEAYNKALRISTDVSWTRGQKS
ncbi:hypothetical protein EDD85DRAFT_962710 [Armillaria nabsnona]|nr:hypothetical protein EDD85DRAFT_962710 [Armillaria nabsnona]